MKNFFFTFTQNRNELLVNQVYKQKANFSDFLAKQRATSKKGPFQNLHILLNKNRIIEEK